MKTKLIVVGVVAPLAWLVLTVAAVADTCDDNWDDRFAIPGVSGSSSEAFAVSGTKTLIVNPPAGNRFYRLHKP